jgi:hypothetical protein
MNRPTITIGSDRSKLIMPPRFQLVRVVGEQHQRGQPAEPMA